MPDQDHQDDAQGGPARPYGKDEVMSELLRAAAELFAQRGPERVSVREIAERAGVNHALIFRHFHTKESLLTALLDRDARAFSGAITAADDPASAAAQLFDAIAANDEFARTLAFAVLTGRDPKQLVSRHGAIAKFKSVLARHRPGGEAAPGDSAVAGAVLALAMGWLLFEPFILAAQEIPSSERPGMREQVKRLLARLADAP